LLLGHPGVGFCFGGGVLLELAREGREFRALTVFHVTYPQSVDPVAPSRIKGAVLVLHGADDPVTPRKRSTAAGPNPHSNCCTAGCPTHRDFVPWRFSDADRISVWLAQQSRRPKT
jgi:dienelactone hydrolase